MPRTTIDLDASVLAAVKRLAQEQGRSLGDVVSELLAIAIGKEPRARRPLRWKSHRMRSRVDLEDKDAVYRALDGR